MQISEKIRRRIASLNESEEFKELMLDILKEEGKGTHQYTKIYEKMVDRYLNLKGGETNDQNHEN